MLSSKTNEFAKERWMKEIEWNFASFMLYIWEIKLLSNERIHRNFRKSFLLQPKWKFTSLLDQNVQSAPIVLTTVVGLDLQPLN